MNVEEINGSSAWFRLHGEHFKGEKIPFGALVEFKPSNARGDKREQLEPKGETGVFAAYNLSGLSQDKLRRRRPFHKEGEDSTPTTPTASNREDRFELFPFKRSTRRGMRLLKVLRRSEGKMIEAFI